MSCRRFREAITDHACGAPIDDAAAAHLGSCARCRAALDEEQRLIADLNVDLGRALAITASDNFAERVSTRVQAARANAVPGTFATRWWLSAAAAVAVMAVGVYFAWPAYDSVAPQQTAASSASAPEQARSTRVDAPASATTSAKAAPRKRTPPAASTRRTAAIATLPTSTELKVVVPTTQARAIARMKELVKNGVLSGAPLEISAPPDELVIAPLSVPGLVVPNAETGKAPGSGSIHDRQ
jgi:hypothetical protein